MRLSAFAVGLLALMVAPGLVEAQASPAARPPTMRMACGLGGLSDWSTSFPFVDLAMLSRGWVEIDASKPIDYPHGDPVKGLTFPADADGYPLEIPCQGKLATTVFLVGIPREIYPQGKLTLLFDGTGEIHLDWDAGDLSVQGSGKNTKFEFEPTFTDESSTGVLMTLVRSDKADPVKNVRVIMPGFLETYEKDIWNPKFLDDLRPFAVLRFMDWCRVNNSQQSDWSQRKTRTTFGQTGYFDGKGAAYELMIELGNRLDKDIWLCVPHMADDNYMEQLAALTAANLKPGLKCYIEWSNETWNGIFEQSSWANSHGQHVGNAVRLFRAFDKAFKNDSSRYVKVLGSWTIAQWLTEHHIALMGDRQGMNPDGVKADAVGIAPYIGHDADGDVDSVLKGMAASIAGTAEHCRRHREICDKAGLQLICYEGGPHALKGDFVEANGDPRIYDIYMDYLKALAPHVSMFNQYVAVGRWGQYGCWGAKEYVGQPLSEAHKYRALMVYANSGPPASD